MTVHDLSTNFGPGQRERVEALRDAYRTRETDTVLQVLADEWQADADALTALLAAAEERERLQQVVERVREFVGQWEDDEHVVFPIREFCALLPSPAGPKEA